MHKHHNKTTTQATSLRHLGHFFCVATMTLAVHQAYAADVATQTLSEINVTATKDSADTPTHGYTVKTSKSATKTDTELKEIPQSVSVVTRQQIEDQKPRTVSEALRYTPGVFTDLVGSTTRYDYIVLRGFSDHPTDNEFLDGLRLLGDPNGYNTLQIDPYAIERLDVIRGPASVTYGQASPGGLVAISSKQPLDEDYHEVFATIGNRKQRALGLDFGGKIPDRDDLSYRLVVKGSGADAQQNGSKTERYLIAPSLKWKIDDKNTLLLQAYLQKDPSTGYHGALPYEGTVIPHNGITLPASFNEDSAGGGMSRNQQYYGYQFEHAFNDSWKFQSKYRLQHTQINTSQLSDVGWDGDTLNPSHARAQENANTHVLDNNLQGIIQTGGIKHTLLAGMDYRSMENTGRNYYDYDYQYGGVTYNYVSSNYTFKDKLSQLGVYLQDQLALDKWRLTVGVRDDKAKTEHSQHNISAGTDANNTWSGNKATKRIGLNYLADNGLSPYISYSDGFDPSLTYATDKSGNVLAPTTSKQTEVGVRYQPVGSNTVLSAAVYNLQQENVATYDSATAAYEAIGTVRSKGLELEASTKLTDQLSVLASYTYVDMEVVQGTYQGKTPYAAPKHKATVWADYAFSNGLNLGGGVRYVSWLWADSANTLKIPEATLVDLSLRYDLARFSSSLKGTTVSLNANNLLNKKYIASCYSSYACYYGETRTVALTVSHKW